MSTSPDNLLFLVCVAWLFTHELDAIKHHEWRILPLTSWMSDTVGYGVFVILHIPLFTFIMMYLDSIVFQLGFDIFLILHAGLHILFRQNSAYTFNSTISQILIFGVVPLAIGHLLIITI